MGLPGSPAVCVSPPSNGALKRALVIVLLLAVVRVVYAYTLPMSHTRELAEDCVRGFMATTLMCLSFVAERYTRITALACVMRGLALVSLCDVAIDPCVRQIYWTGRNFPIADGLLAQADRWLGFDWPTYVAAFRGHDRLLMGLWYAYETIAWQPFAIGFFLAVRGRTRDLYAFVVAQALTLTLVCLGTMLLPAYGAWHHFHLAAREFAFVPGGDMDQMTLPIKAYRAGFLEASTTVALVQFPSYHASACLLCGWAAWATRMRYPILAINIAMLASAPIYGSHYLTDLIGGLAVAALAIVAARHALGATCLSSPHARAPVGVVPAGALIADRSGVVSA